MNSVTWFPISHRGKEKIEGPFFCFNPWPMEPLKEDANDGYLTATEARTLVDGWGERILKTTFNDPERVIREDGGLWPFFGFNDKANGISLYDYLKEKKLLK